MYSAIDKCRLCGNENLRTIVSIGEQSLTGVFPKSANEEITSGPLELVKCITQNNQDNCGLVQLKHSYDLKELYGDNYGYRSGLNNSMVNHLSYIVKKNLDLVMLEKDDMVIDIGSNDGTLLKLYPQHHYQFAGIDPTALKFKKYYTDNILIIPEFFSSSVFQQNFGTKKAKIITSIAMFYDLENPLAFVNDIYNTLDDDGIWVFEQSYMPAMINMNAYDTICHEHLEYYCLKQIKWLLDKAGLKILDIEMNDTNGGSFKLIAAKKENKKQECTSMINKILEEEKYFDSPAPFEKFEKNIVRHRNDLIALLKSLKQQQKKVFGYGASTKGNVIMQYCGFTTADIPYIAEVNSDKFGAFTPKTNIPIISEQQAKEMKPDYFLVLPWHFRNNILEREKDILASGTKFIFPLPSIEIIGK